MNWSEKYRPITLDELYLSNDNKNKIKKWMSDFKDKKIDYNNCLILHGAPGIGKTSLANIILETNDFDVIEFNSSDIRNQKTLKDKIESINGNVNILDFMCNKKKRIGIIIDELDGINNSERGALKELSTIINNTKEYSSPFICTTNSTNKKIDLIIKKGVYIKLAKPSKKIIGDFISKICLNESIDISISIKKLIINTSQLDFRRVIVLMEYLFSYNISKLNEDELEHIIINYNKKTVDYTSYEATDKVLNNYYKDFNNIVYGDSCNIGYLVYENFQNFIISNKKCSDKHKLDIIAQIYNSFNSSDTIDKKIYINQHFELKNYNDFYKFNIPSYLINSLSKTSYNKFNKLNYSTMINKISFEYLNINVINAIQKMGISNNYIYTCDYIYSCIKTNDPIIISIIQTNEIDKTFMEKICKLSSLYSKDDSVELKKLVSKYFKLFL